MQPNFSLSNHLSPSANLSGELPLTAPLTMTATRVRLLTGPRFQIAPLTTPQEISRPSNRSSVGSVASSLPSRHPHSHSHSRGNSSSLAASLNPAHRVSRRKSVSTSAASNAAAAAAAASGEAAPRRTSKNNYGPRGPAALSGYPSIPSSLPNNGSAFAAASSYSKGSAVADGPPLASIPDLEKGNSKSRIRRASEGSRVTKEGSKRASGNELRCEKCGKGYKHSSCLTKHLSVSPAGRARIPSQAGVRIPFQLVWCAARWKC